MQKKCAKINEKTAKKGDFVSIFGIFSIKIVYICVGLMVISCQIVYVRYEKLASISHK